METESDEIPGFIFPIGRRRMQAVKEEEEEDEEEGVMRYSGSLETLRCKDVRC